MSTLAASQLYFSPCHTAATSDVVSPTGVSPSYVDEKASFHALRVSLEIQSDTESINTVFSPYAQAIHVSHFTQHHDTSQHYGH